MDRRDRPEVSWAQLALLFPIGALRHHKPSAVTPRCSRFAIGGGLLQGTSLFDSRRQADTRNRIVSAAGSLLDESASGSMRPEDFPLRFAEVWLAVGEAAATTGTGTATGTGGDLD